jgi:hypothetical protein
MSASVDRAFAVRTKAASFPPSIWATAERANWLFLCS